MFIHQWYSNRRKILLSRIAALLTIFMLIVGAFPNIQVQGNADYLDHWAKDTISEWLANDWVQGVGNGKFEPDRAITRAEFIVMLMKKVSAQEPEDKIYFSDVSKEDWFYYLTSKARHNGYVLGDENGLLRPYDTITREEAVTIVGRVFKIQSISEDYEHIKHFADFAKLHDYSKKYVNEAVKRGFLKGYPDNTLLPDKSMTRAEAIVFIDRVEKGINAVQPVIPTGISSSISSSGGGGGKKSSNNPSETPKPTSEPTLPDLEDSISGRIYLPQGYTAPKGGVEINICLKYAIDNLNQQNLSLDVQEETDNEAKESNSGNSSSGKGKGGTVIISRPVLPSSSVVISEGKNFVEYCIPKPNSCDLVKIYCRVSPYYAGGEYLLNEIYYSSSGSTMNSDEADVLDLAQNNINNINMTIQKAPRTISGRVSLPNGERAPSGGIELRVAVNSTSYKYVTIQEGEKYADYAIGVMENQAGEEYKLYYVIDSYEKKFNAGKYLTDHRIYYKDDGMTLDEEEADIIDVTAGNAIRDLMVIDAPKTISGTISLPNGKGTKDESISIWVSADNYFRYVTIPKGQNTVHFTIGVKDEEEYVLAYMVDDEEYKGFDYLKGSRVYYTTYGMSTKNENLEFIDVTDGNIENIQLTLLEAKVVQGKIKLPDNQTALSGGIPVDLRIVNNNFRNSGTIVIPEGKGEVDYKLQVLPSGEGEPYIVYYYIYKSAGNPKYYNTLYRSNIEVYYSSAGMTLNYGQAERLSIAEDISVNITLMPNRLLSGTVKLPEGKRAPEEGISVEIQLEAVEHWGHYYETVNIPSGSSLAEYMIAVPIEWENEEYILSYSVLNNSEYLRQQQFYLTANGWSLDYESAEKICFEGKNIHKDITLIAPNKFISGKIKLPEGETAPEGGIFVSLEVYNVDTGVVFFDDISISEGENSADYQVGVLSDLQYENYIVSYILDSSVEDYLKGQRIYYSESGATLERDSATIVSLQGAYNKENVDFTLFKAVLISGTISLPNDEIVTGESGLDIKIYVRDIDFDSLYTKDITIPKGQNNVTYTIGVAPNRDYKLYYYVTGGTSGSRQSSSGGTSHGGGGGRPPRESYKHHYLKKNVYYCQQGVTINSDLASIIQVQTEPVSDIDMSLLYDGMFKFNIYLPTVSDTVYNEVYADIKVTDVLNNLEYMKRIYIPQESTSVTDVVDVPYGSKYTISYTSNILKGEWLSYGKGELIFPNDAVLTSEIVYSLILSDEIDYIKGTLFRSLPYSMTLYFDAVSELDQSEYRFAVTYDERDIQLAREIRFIVPVLPNQSGNIYSLKCILNDITMYYSKYGHGELTPDPEEKKLIDIRTYETISIEIS